jgi:hypothetical protein
VLAEFEQDGPEAVDRLVAAAGTPQFDHVVSQLRSDRASAEALAEATDHYTERGFTILEDDDRWGWKLHRVPQRHLQRTGDDGEPEGVFGHAGVGAEVRLAQSRRGTFPGPRRGGSGPSPVPPRQTSSPRSSSPPAICGTGRYADPFSVRAIPRSTAATILGRNSAAGMIE